MKDRATKEQFVDAKPGKLVEKEAKRRGLIMRSAEHFVAFAPPLICREGDVDEMCDILEECIRVVQGQLLGS